jgi:hypothetical protein
MPCAERWVCVSVHDVAPATWPQCQRLLTMLDALGPVPLTLLVVPDFHRAGTVERAPEFVRAIEHRLARGDEVALHGYFHLDESPTPRTPGDWIRRRLLTQREGEFAALDEGEARRRLDLGLEMVHRLGWPVRGFVAPAWLLSAGTRAALSQLPFVYTTSRAGLYRLPDWDFQACPALTYSARSGWRRAMSKVMVEGQAAAARSQTSQRIALHPVDARHESVVAHWRLVIERALAKRQPLTKAAWAAASASAEYKPA